METHHEAMLNRKWERFQEQCNDIHAPLSTLEIALYRIVRGWKPVARLVDTRLLAQITEIEQFQCPLCHENIGPIAFNSRLDECPYCKFPNLMMM